LIMYTTPMTKRYELNEKDIDTVLKILRLSNPNATPEMAIDILENTQADINLESHTDFEGLVKKYNRLKKEKKMKTN
jgi:CelD/BcsL family acetyltransferase involved in cellulose biosynthesis